MRTTREYAIGMNTDSTGLSNCRKAIVSTASAFVSAGRLYFGTATSETSDICAGHATLDAEQGNFYVFDFEGMDIISGVVGNMHIDPLVTDEHLYLMTSSGLQSIGKGGYNNKLIYKGLPKVNIISWEEMK